MLVVCVHIILFILSHFSFLHQKKRPEHIHLHLEFLQRVTLTTKCFDHFYIDVLPTLTIKGLRQLIAEITEQLPDLFMLFAFRDGVFVPLPLPSKLSLPYKNVMFMMSGFDEDKATEYLDSKLFKAAESGSVLADGAVCALLSSDTRPLSDFFSPSSEVTISFEFIPLSYYQVEDQLSSLDLPQVNIPEFFASKLMVSFFSFFFPFPFPFFFSRITNSNYFPISVQLK